MRIDKTVFLSYRHTNVPWALAIFQSLHHDGYDVFFDFTGVASGDFERVILGHIEARAHFLMLLTPSALEECSNADDWLRREIETALETKRNVVPLMLEGFDFDTPGIANHLTGRLAALKNNDALRVSVVVLRASPKGAYRTLGSTLTRPSVYGLMLPKRTLTEACCAKLRAT